MHIVKAVAWLGTDPLSLPRTVGGPFCTPRPAEGAVCTLKGRCKTTKPPLSLGKQQGRSVGNQKNAMKFYHSEGFGPHYDEHQRMRCRFPSPMVGPVIDRAADRLTVSGWALSDLPVLRLARLLSEDLTRSEYLATVDELRRRREHATHEEDTALLRDLVDGKVVSL